jgi:Ku70/Ku80 beta-barrel domain
LPEDEDEPVRSSHVARKRVEMRVAHLKTHCPSGIHQRINLLRSICCLLLAHAATNRSRQAFSCDLDGRRGGLPHDPQAEWKADQIPKGHRDRAGLQRGAEEEIIKGHEHTKGHHVLIEPNELDALKLEAKHTIDMKTFVDLDQIDSRYFEKPYYLLPDGDEADEGYVVLRDALAKSKKMAVGQLVVHGREHLVGITAHKKGLMLLILR